MSDMRERFEAEHGLPSDCEWRSQHAPDGYYYIGSLSTHPHDDLFALWKSKNAEITALQEENERLKSASSISEFTDGLIASMFAMRWAGPESEDLQMAKTTLYKSLKNQTDGFWSGHTVYHIMIDGGFLFDAKSNTNKTLTPLGRQFMRDIEMEALQEEDK